MSDGAPPGDPPASKRPSRGNRPLGPETSSNAKRKQRAVGNRSRGMVDHHKIETYKDRHWVPEPATMLAIKESLRIPDAMELTDAENAEEVIENNMRYHALVGRRILDAAAAMIEDRTPTRDALFLIDEGLRHRKIAQAAAEILLPYRKARKAPEKAAPVDEPQAPMGTEIEAIVRDQIAVQIGETFLKAKRRDQTDEKPPSK